MFSILPIPTPPFAGGGDRIGKEGVFHLAPYAKYYAALYKWLFGVKIKNECAGEKRKDKRIKLHRIQGKMYVGLKEGISRGGG